MSSKCDRIEAVPAEENLGLHQDLAPSKQIDQPLVSVIICAYNAEIFIAETLQSLLAQTYPRIEILVVDDGSTDGTAAIVQAFAPKVRYFYQPNAGSSSARNIGIHHSSGDLLCFFDADDLMPPDRLARQVSFLQRHPDVRLVICDYQNFMEQGRTERTHFQTCPILQAQLRGKSEIVLKDACTIMAQEHFGITGTLFLDRSLLEHVPGFDVRLRGCEDFHLYYRLARHTRVGIINTVGMLRRIHTDNLSNNWELILSESIHSYIMLRDTERNPRTRRLLNVQVASFWAALARQKANHGSYGAALDHEFRAMITGKGGRQFMKTIYGVIRTLAIALSLHRPSEN